MEALRNTPLRQSEDNHWASSFYRAVQKMVEFQARVIDSHVNHQLYDFSKVRQREIRALEGCLLHIKRKAEKFWSSVFPDQYIVIYDDTLLYNLCVNIVEHAEIVYWDDWVWNANALIRKIKIILDDYKAGHVVANLSPQHIEPVKAWFSFSFFNKKIDYSYLHQYLTSNYSEDLKARILKYRQPSEFYIKIKEIVSRRKPVIAAHVKCRNADIFNGRFEEFTELENCLNRIEVKGKAWGKALFPAVQPEIEIYDDSELYSLCINICKKAERSWWYEQVYHANKPITEIETVLSQQKNGEIEAYINDPYLALLVAGRVSDISEYLKREEEKRCEALELSPVRVQIEPFTKLIPSNSEGELEFICCLSRRLTAYKTASELADTDLIKIQEGGRWEKTKNFVKEAAHLIGSLVVAGEAAVALAGHGLKLAHAALEKLEPLYKLSKKACGIFRSSNEMIEIITHSKDLTLIQRLERHIRVCLGDPKLTQKEQLIQFALIFGGIPKATKLFIQRLVWRYKDQLAMLGIEGGRQLALVVWRHVQRFFRLDFLDWRDADINTQLFGNSEERAHRMLIAMWRWVDEVSFLMLNNESEDITLFHGGIVKATVLLHQAGYKCKNEKNEVYFLEVRKMDQETGCFIESEGQKWGYRNTTAWDPIMDQFKVELYRYQRTGEIKDSGMFTPYTLQRYMNCSFIILKELDFNWSTAQARIIVLEKKSERMSKRLDDMNNRLTCAEGRLGLIPNKLLQPIDETSKIIGFVKASKNRESTEFFPALNSLNEEGWYASPLSQISNPIVVSLSSDEGESSDDQKDLLDKTYKKVV